VQGNALTPKGNAFPGFIKVSFPNKGNSGIFKDSQFPFFIGLSSFIGSCNLFTETASKLGRKVKVYTKGTINNGS